MKLFGTELNPRDHPRKINYFAPREWTNRWQFSFRISFQKNKLFGGEGGNFSLKVGGTLPRNSYKPSQGPINSYPVKENHKDRGALSKIHAIPMTFSGSSRMEKEGKNNLD